MLPAIPPTATSPRLLVTSPATRRSRRRSRLQSRRTIHRRRGTMHRLRLTTTIPPVTSKLTIKAPLMNSRPKLRSLRRLFPITASLPPLAKITFGRPVTGTIRAGITGFQAYGCWPHILERSGLRHGGASIADTIAGTQVTGVRTLATTAASTTALDTPAAAITALIGIMIGFGTIGRSRM